MAIYLTSIIIAVCAVELFLRAPLYEVLSTMLRYAKKSSRVIGSRKISDHWKEKILPVYSQKIAEGSLKLFFMFLIICAILLVVSMALDFLFLTGTTTLGYLSTWQGVVFVTLLSTLYYFARTKLFFK